MVKLELYRVFREVAEAGNISLAAENLYLSQSAVSQSVKQLEQQLGTRLFLRSPRGVTLTEDGRLLFEYVRSAMGLLETGEDKLQQSRTLQAGTLVIGASDTVTSQFLLPHLDASTAAIPTSTSASSAAAAIRCWGFSAPEGRYRLCERPRRCGRLRAHPLL